MIAGPDEKTSMSLQKKGGRKTNPPPQSLRNLELGKWKKGQSGNPNGRPNAGAVMIEYFNEFHKLTKAEVETIRDDENASVARRTAAKVWLNALQTDGEAAMILDRTVGKPAQSVDVTSNGESVNLSPIVLDGDREL